MKMTLLLESQPRHAAFYKAKDGKWYLEMADNPEPEPEYDEDGEEEEYYGPEGGREDSTTYGPFPSQEAADQFMSDNWANPGSFYEDDSGKAEVPKKSPNGKPVVSPAEYGRGRGYYGSGGSYGYGGFGGGRSYYSPPPASKPAAKPTAPTSPAKPAPDAPAGKAAQPPAPAGSKRSGPKSTYKVYNGTGTGKPVIGSSPIHTRIKGKVYAPTGISKFKANDKPTVAIEPDGKSAKVSDGDRSQVWTHRESLDLLRDYLKLIV